MKVGFLTFEQFHGKKDIGSSRIRANWVCKYWPEAETFKMGQKYDVIVFQKVYWIEYAKLMREHCPETIMILDICDADFLHWGHRVKQMIDLCDAVVTSTIELAKYMIKITDKPVAYIPDRLDLEQFDGYKKEHSGDAKTVAWFGYSENFPMLDSAIMSLIKYKYERLVVVAGKTPYKLPYAQTDRIELANYPWSPTTVHRDLLTADIVINPQSKVGKWKYKSNNKTITAWALGLPVALDESDLLRFREESCRVQEAEKRLKEVKEKYDVKQSIEEYKQLINQIKDGKLNLA